MAVFPGQPVPEEQAILDFTEVEMMAQLDHVQVVCTSLQTDTTPAPRHRPDGLPAAQPTVLKH